VHCAATKHLLKNFFGIILKTKPFGFKVRRQHPFSNYILDFYYHALNLVIEVDGTIHQLQEVKKMMKKDKSN